MNFGTSITIDPNSPHAATSHITVALAIRLCARRPRVEMTSADSLELHQSNEPRSDMSEKHGEKARGQWSIVYIRSVIFAC